MLELSNAKLELVQIVTRNEVQLLDEASQQPHRLLTGARTGAAHTRGQLAQQLLEDFDDALSAPGVGHAFMRGSRAEQTDARETRAS
jgi:hypothetical protein